MSPEEARARLGALGFAPADVSTLAAHFLDAERRGKRGHGVSRIEWLETLSGLDPAARPAKTRSLPGYDEWDGRGALGYLTLAAICDDVASDPPDPARVIAARDCFPTGMLGYWVRRLADAGLVALLTATSPPRLSHPAGGSPVVGTNPLAIGIPAADGRPIVCDVSMGRVTYGDVLAGLARQDELVPFGGEQAHKAFALALGLQLLVQSQVCGDYGAFLVVLRDRFGPTDVREQLRGLRLPGDA